MHYLTRRGKLELVRARRHLVLLKKYDLCFQRKLKISQLIVWAKKPENRIYQRRKKKLAAIYKEMERGWEYGNSYGGTGRYGCLAGELGLESPYFVLGYQVYQSGFGKHLANPNVTWIVLKNS